MFPPDYFPPPEQPAGIYDPALDPAVNEPLALSAPRSPEWPLVRAAHLRFEPECVACGSRTALSVHHVEPFHLNPGRELDPGNLVTLCECPAHNCHLIFGHVLNWQLGNPDARSDARRYRMRMRQVRGDAARGAADPAGGAK